MHPFVISSRQIDAVFIAPSGIYASITAVIPEKMQIKAQAVRSEKVPDETLFMTACEKGGVGFSLLTTVIFLCGKKQLIIPQITDDIQMEKKIILPEFLDESIMLPSAFTAKPIPGLMQKSMSFSACDSDILPVSQSEFADFTPERYPPVCPRIKAKIVSDGRLKSFSVKKEAIFLTGFGILPLPESDAAIRNGNTDGITVSEQFLRPVKNPFLKSSAKIIRKTKNKTPEITAA